LLQTSFPIRVGGENTADEAGPYYFCKRLPLCSTQTCVQENLVIAVHVTSVTWEYLIRRAKRCIHVNNALSIATSIGWAGISKLGSPEDQYSPLHKNVNTRFSCLFSIWLVSEAMISGLVTSRALLFLPRGCLPLVLFRGL
jgi:hypothetical protein